MKKISEYIKPNSFTWWSALAAIGYGIYTMNPESIITGLIGIGIRRAVAQVNDK